MGVRHLVGRHPTKSDYSLRMASFFTYFTSAFGLIGVPIQCLIHPHIYPG
jgi:hypothetical protein